MVLGKWSGPHIIRLTSRMIIYLGARCSGRFLRPSKDMRKATASLLRLEVVSCLLSKTLETRTSSLIYLLNPAPYVNHCVEGLNVQISMSSRSWVAMTSQAVLQAAHIAMWREVGIVRCPGLSFLNCQCGLNICMNSWHNYAAKLKFQCKHVTPSASGREQISMSSRSWVAMTWQAVLQAAHRAMWREAWIAYCPGLSFLNCQCGPNICMSSWHNYAAKLKFQCKHVTPSASGREVVEVECRRFGIDPLARDL